MKTEMPDLSARAATFRKGDRVETTREGQKVYNARLHGVVTAASCEPYLDYMTVRLDGAKRGLLWGIKFWGWRKVNPKKGKRSR